MYRVFTIKISFLLLSDLSKAIDHYLSTLIGKHMKNLCQHMQPVPFTNTYKRRRWCKTFFIAALYTCTVGRDVFESIKMAALLTCVVSVFIQALLPQLTFGNGKMKEISITSKFTVNVSLSLRKSLGQ